MCKNKKEENSIVDIELVKAGYANGAAEGRPLTTEEKLAMIAEPRDKITAADLKKLRKGKKKNGIGKKSKKS